MLRLASAPVSWGVDFADDPLNPPWDEVLDGIAAAGYRWTELGPAGYLPPEAGQELAARGLAATAGFVFAPLEERSTLDAAERAAAAIARAGGRFLVIIDAVGSGGGGNRLLDGLAAVAATARRHGLRPLVHPHAGTGIEDEAAIRAAMEVADLCLDTGHLLYAGIDPAAFLRGAPGRVPYLHLKDVDPDRVRPRFWDSVAAGAFVPLGEGALDLDALIETLDATGFDGWAVVEQDRRAGTGDPVQDARRSRLAVERRLRVTA